MGIKNMAPEEIREKLKRIGFSPAGIARDVNRSTTAIYQVIDGISVSHFIRSHIAVCLGLEVEEIWPETYLLNGGPTKPGRPKTHGLYKRAA